MHVLSAEAYADELRHVGLGAGLHQVGVTTAAPFDGARRSLEDRKAAGLNGTMQFTYRNPARSTDPRRTLSSARSLVVGAYGYSSDVPARPGDGPQGRVARYATDDHYRALRAGLVAVADRLVADGWQARVVLDDNALVDRAAAHRAALGWYGKSANVLIPGAGSWFVLGSVLTDAALAPAQAPVVDGCGSCTRCLDGCPTGAIVAPGVVDARRCLAWVVQAEGDIPVELRAALGDRLYGCDECQEVCPPNRRAGRAARSPGAAGAPGAPGPTNAPGAVPVRLGRHDEVGRDEAGRDEAGHDAAGHDAAGHDAAGHDAAGHDAVAARDAAPADGQAGTGTWVSLLDLLAASDEELLARHGRWYIPRREPRYLRRNALVALGNVGDPTDPRVAATLARYVEDPDPMLARHATWAAERAGRAGRTVGVGR